jgi:hypothetical protein
MITEGIKPKGVNKGETDDKRSWYFHAMYIDLVNKEEEGDTSKGVAYGKKRRNGKKGTSRSTGGSVRVQ